MKVVIAPDSFKGTFTAAEVAHAIANGVRSGGAQGLEMPVADGGEGTLDALWCPLVLMPIPTPARNPWRETVAAALGLSPTGTAVIELAQTCGLHVPHSAVRDPRTASTFGVGQQVASAITRGAKHVIVAAGGSATTDGGAGAIAAIEARGGLRGARPPS